MKRILILGATIFQILGSNLPMALNWGQSISARSDQAGAIITPPGYAFAIWGVIFASCLAYGIYAVYKRNEASSLIDKVAWPSITLFTLCGAWGLWVPFYGTDAVSFVIIAGAALTGMRLIQLMGPPKKLTRAENGLVVFPLSLLSGWIITATFISIIGTANFYNVSVIDPNALYFSLPLLVILTGVVSTLIWQQKNAWYALAPIWGLSTLSLGKFTSNTDLEIAVAAILGALVILVVSFLAYKKG